MGAVLMAWQQPQLTDPPMGPTDEIRKLQHRLIFAYPRNSKAVELGVTESGIFDAATDQALRNLQPHLNPPQSADGVLRYATKVATGVLVLPPKAPAKRFVQQGVGYNTNAFLMGQLDHSYVEATDEGADEQLRLALPLVGQPKVGIGYSMGADTLRKALERWPTDRRDEWKLIVTFGNPSRRPGPTLLGDNPPGQGISGTWYPEWTWDRLYDFAMPGDMYPNAVGLLPQLYDILTRMEVSLTFAAFLFGKLTSAFGPALLGLAKVAVPVAGAVVGGAVPGLAPVVTVATAGFGALSSIAGLVTEGPEHQTGGPVLDVLSLFALLPKIIQTISAALKFVSTNAHYHYHDQPQAQWRGLTGVDCAAQIIAEKVRSATVYTVPGTVASWNDGPGAWTAWKLP